MTDKSNIPLDGKKKKDSCPILGPNLPTLAQQGHTRIPKTARYLWKLQTVSLFIAPTCSSFSVAAISLGWKPLWHRSLGNVSPWHRWLPRPLPPDQAACLPSSLDWCWARGETDPQRRQTWSLGQGTYQLAGKERISQRYLLIETIRSSQNHKNMLQ